MRLIKKIILFAFIAYVALVTFTILAQRSFMYFPDKTTPDITTSDVPDMAVVSIPTPDGLALNGWYHQAKTGQKTVLFMHGNGGNMLHRDHKARALVDAGYGILMFDYRGYGGNEGAPNYDGLMMDARAAREWLYGLQISPKNLVLYGESLGTGIAAEMAAEQAPAALILETPYTSIGQLVAEYYYRHIPFAQKLVWDNYNVIDNVALLSNVPVLVLHGEQDKIVPHKYGKAVFDAAVDPKEFWSIPEGRHNNLDTYGSQEEISRFIGAL